jgi:radical SAM superfamily enzyme YgiQ (UPF0313 family)
LEEIRRLQGDYGIGAFEFRDDIFTLNMDRARELCDAMVAERIRIIWDCETRVDRVDLDLLRRMKRAGCVRVDFGVESGSEESLERIGKKFTKDEARKAFAYCHEVGLPTRAFFMLGMPWDTPQTVAETVAFAKELRPTMSMFFLAMPYPGTRLRSEFAKAGWPVPDNYDDYRHWIEGGGYELAERPNGRQDPLRRFARECRRATKEIIKAQIRDVRHYPELLRAYHRRYSAAETGIRVFQRLKQLL